ncbi:hypothetical protein ACHAXN_012479 [Cyclotella atomus]
MSFSPNEELTISDGQFRIGYASDIEGHWDYFLDYVSRSNVLDWESVPSSKEPKHNFHRLALRPNTYFVFGGDSVDKGPGDIRFTRAMVELKQRYPDRVHLLVGNRDLNKLRFQTELGEYEMSLPVEMIEKPFWDANAMSYKEFLQKKSDGLAIEEMNTKVNKLKWMLDHTLGCLETFEFRRQEIGILKQIYGHYPLNYDSDVDFHSTVLNEVEVDPSIATDEQVVQSFEHEINHQMGSLRQYLKHASIAAIIGNTIFVHGAIDVLTMKFVPSLESKFERPSAPPVSLTNLVTMTSTNAELYEETMIENVHEWVDSLNNFLHHGLKDFEERPNWNAERTSRGGEALLAIQNRPSMWGRSVVCNSYGDGGVIATSTSQAEQMNALKTSVANADPLVFEGTASNVFDPKPAKWLSDQGIRRIVVGHKPTGDCPSVLSAEYTGVEVVSADTSYSHRKELDVFEHPFGVCRGAAISLVEIVGTAHSNWLETSGSLACGRQYNDRFQVLSPVNCVPASEFGGGDHNLGKRLPDGWWVKAAISPDQYHLCRGSGRIVEYEIRSRNDVTMQLSNI